VDLCLIVHGAGLERENFSGKTKPIGALESISCENLRSQFDGEMGGWRLTWEGMAGLGSSRIGAGMLIECRVEMAQRAGQRVQRTFYPSYSTAVLAIPVMDWACAFVFMGVGRWRDSSSKAGVLARTSRY
jgi:hypothetical protein